MTTPIVSIIYENGRWRADAPAVPALQMSSVTLWSLLTTMADRVTVETEQAYKDLATQGRSMPLQDHASKAVADEREACAQIADYVSGRAAKAAMEMSYSELYGENCKVEAADEIANAIRARAMVAEQQTEAKP